MRIICSKVKGKRAYFGVVAREEQGKRTKVIKDQNILRVLRINKSSRGEESKRLMFSKGYKQKLKGSRFMSRPFLF